MSFRFYSLLGLLITLCACQAPATETPLIPSIPIYTSDVDHYWEAYDKIIATDDSLEKLAHLEKLYFERGTLGLAKLREVRRYSAEDYLTAIANYPEFWTAIRSNTLRAQTLDEQVNAGFVKINELYPCPKPAGVYFGVGSFRTNGTVVDSFVLIGTELALADTSVPVHEFPENIRAARADYFAGNPIEKVYGLFVHEFVHTQQEPIPAYLLGQCLYEGVAEFVSCAATGEKPEPAVLYGLEHAETVRAVFTREMFYDNNQYKWLWSNAPNAFNQRDLGYYIGYAISQGYYNRATDKSTAIKELVELDYADTAAVYRIIDESGYFPAPVSILAADYRADQPRVVQLDHSGNKFTVTFSEPMDTRWRNFNYGPGGEATSLRIATVEGWDEAGQRFAFTVQDYSADTKRELVLGPGFRDVDGAGLQPYLIELGE